MKNSKVKTQPLALNFYPILLEIPNIPSHASAQVFHGFIGTTPFQLMSMSVVGTDAEEGVKQFETFLDTVRVTIHDIVGETLTSTESVFDLLLTHINSHWQDHVDKKFHYTFKTGTLILGLFLEGHICIADRGQTSAFLIPCSGLTVHNEGLTPIIDGVGGTLPHSTVLFESVVCGILYPHARLIIGNRSIKLLGRTDDIAHLLQKSTTTPQDIGARIIKKIERGLSEAASIMIVDISKAEHPPQTYQEAKKEAAAQALEARSWGQKSAQGVLLATLFLGTHIGKPFKRSAQFLTDYLKALPRTKKLVLSGIVGIFILLLLSLGATSWHSRSKNATSKINALNHIIDEQKNQLETTIPFQDGPKIQQSLTVIEKALGDMRALGDNGVKNAVLTETSLQPLYDRIQLKKSITLVHEKDFPASTSTPWKLAGTTDTYLAYNTGLRALIVNNKTITLPAEIQSVKPASDNTAVFFKDQRLAMISKDGTITINSLLLPTNEKTIKYALPYGGFLYTVNQEGTIYKHTGVSNGFARPTVWNKEKTLAQSTDAAIDGALYILNATSVEKMFKGTRESFPLTIIPELKAAHHIITFPEFEKVYICEGTAHRIIVLSKTGTLLAQLDTKDPFDDCAINEKTKRGFITRNSELLSFILP